MAVAPVQMILPGMEAYITPKAVQSATKSGIGSFFKSAWRFLQGDWGVDVGREYRIAKQESIKQANILQEAENLAAKAAKRAAKKIKPDVSIWNFDWKTAYHNVDEKKLAEASKKALQAGKNAGMLKKIFSFIGKKLPASLMAIFYIPKIISETKEGGLGAGLKETVKLTASLAAFALGGVLVGMFGWTGVGAFIGTMLIGGALSLGSDTLTKAVLGASCEEQKQMLAQAQEEMKKEGIAGTDKDIKALDERMDSIKKYFDNKIAMNAAGLGTPSSPFGRTTAFSGLSGGDSSFKLNNNSAGFNCFNFSGNSNTTVYQV